MSADPIKRADVLAEINAEIERAKECGPHHIPILVSVRKAVTALTSPQADPAAGAACDRITAFLTRWKDGMFNGDTIFAIGIPPGLVELTVADLEAIISAAHIRRCGMIAQKKDKTSPGGDALRRAGYVPLPRWWVTQDQMDVIERMAKGNRDEVYRIKHGAANG